MKAGDAYTVTANEVSKNFTAIKEDKVAAKLSKVELTDDNVVTVTFDKMLDEVSAETIENYELDNNCKVIEATLNSDRKSVDLKTEGIVKSKRYKLTVGDIDSIDGVGMKSKSTKIFVSKAFDKAPILKSVKNGHIAQSSTTDSRYNNNTLTLEFTTNGHELDKEVAEKIENYSIEGLEIESATYVCKDDQYYVVLVTGQQVAGKTYKLKVENVSDASALKNVMSKVAEKSFKGGYADKQAPSITNGKYIIAESNTKIKVAFSEKNALDPASALDVNNYEFDNDLEVESVEFDDADAPYSTAGKTVILTTSAQDSKKIYKLKISNVQDEYGNAMADGGKSHLRVRGVEAKHNAPYITGIKATTKTEIKITFDRSVDKTTAKDATNYQVFDGTELVSTAVKAKVEGAVVTLTVPELTANKSYKVKVSNISDLEGNITGTISKTVSAPGAKNDVTDPEVVNYDVVAKDEIIVEFNEAVKAKDGTVANIKFTVQNGTAKAYEFVGVQFIDNNTRLIMKANGSSNVFDTTDVLDAKSLTNVIDENRNDLKETDMPAVPAVTEENAKPCVISGGWEQLNVKTIKVTFDQPVDISSASISGYTLSYVGDGETYDEKSAVEFKKTSGLLKADGKDVTLSLAGIKDFLGNAAMDEDGVKTSIVVNPYMEDTDAPMIEDAIAINDHTVEVSFDEELSYAGTYKLEYTNDKGAKVSIATTPKLDKSKVTLTTTTKLKEEVDYKLVINTVAKDIANISLVKADYSEIIFMGSDIETVEVTSGVKHVNANVVKLVGKMVTAPLTFDTLTVTTVASITDKTITADAPFLASQTYKLGSEVSFEGSVENSNGLVFTENSTTATTFEVYFDGMDDEISDTNSAKVSTDYALVYYKVAENGTIAKENAQIATLNTTTNRYEITGVTATDKVLVFLYNNTGATAQDYLLNANPVSGAMK